MICTTDRESWREEARETERAGEGEKRGSKAKLHYFSRFFMPAPEPRPTEPATRAAVIVSASTHGKALASIPLLWSMRNWKQSTPFFQPMQTGGRFTFSESLETWKPAFVPPSSPPKKFQHFTPAICPLKNDLFSHCRKFGSKLGFASFIKELFLKNSDLTNLTQECIFEKEKVVHHR